MSPAIPAAALWVIAAAVTALLPMRRQYAPGITLMVLAPVVIAWLWIDLGWIAGLAATAGFISMFRNPLRYFYKRLKGERPEVPR